MPPDPELVTYLKLHGQEHLLRFWEELDSVARGNLVREIRSLDLDRLDSLIHSLVLTENGDSSLPPIDRVKPIDVRRLPRTDAERVARRQVAEIGAAALAAGEVGVVLVAGGSGTRLGFEGPKGTYPIGAVTGSSLFQIHAEKIVAAGKRYGKPIPLYVMTSPENNQSTSDFFATHKNFGLSHVRFFVQGQMPAVDQSAGKVLLAGAGQIALSPDGHGGTLKALAQPDQSGVSCLDEMRNLGIRTLSYFQVDNPLVRIADPAFLGLHRQAGAEMSFKVIEKQFPEEKLGVVVSVDGIAQVIEYSDLPPVLAERREPEGGLELWAGSIAVHILERSFIERLVSEHSLPYHRAFKKVAYINDSGTLVKPSTLNAVKFETFIFDALPLAERSVLAESNRSIEFEPLKNATGPDSPVTVRQQMSNVFADWLEGAGAIVPRKPDGSSEFAIEISPLYALDAVELKSKLAPGFVVEGPLAIR